MATQAQRLNSRFQRGAGVYKCNVCGKQTRGNAECAHAKLCVDCWDYAGWENQHSDEGHKAERRDPDCPVCAKEFAAA